MLWDEDANLLDIRGATAAGPGHLKLTTGELTVVASDVLGKIEFQAPAETGTDAITVAASIAAVAQDTFTGAVNATDLIFYTGHSEAATEKFRFTSQGEIGIAGANYGSDGQVLTSTGGGTAVAWECAAAGASAANQTEQEAACITTKYTSPGTQQFHPSAAKGWVFDSSCGCSANASYNVSGVVSGSTGTQTVSWDVDFSSGNYGIAGATHCAGHASFGSIAAGSIVGTFRNDCHNVADMTYGLAVFGDQA
jgi:hypothetical protein